DVISTGGSVIQAADALRAAAIEPIGVLAIFTYGFDFSQQNLAAAQLPYYTLTDYTKLLVELFKKEGVSEKTMASLHEWRKNPDTWEPRKG
ncbi:MAG: orotate phosphoribosyltransferase, partial [Bacteroidota bacterium]